MFEANMVTKIANSASPIIWKLQTFGFLAVLTRDEIELLKKFANLTSHLSNQEIFRLAQQADIREKEVKKLFKLMKKHLGIDRLQAVDTGLKSGLYPRIMA